MSSLVVSWVCVVRAVAEETQTLTGEEGQAMRWSELIVSSPTALVFPDGIEAGMTYYQQVVRSEWHSHAVIAIPGKTELDLLDAVDDGQTVDEPRIHAIFGERPDEVFLFGGPKAYRLSSAGEIHGPIELYREREFEEYWYTTLVNTEQGVVIIYETGCLLLDSALRVRWHVEKYVNDFFDKVVGNRLEFLYDHDDRWSLSVIDGSR
jgi:hypothetical protein